MNRGTSTAVMAVTAMVIVVVWLLIQMNFLQRFNAGISGPTSSSSLVAMCKRVENAFRCNVTEMAEDTALLRECSRTFSLVGDAPVECLFKCRENDYCAGATLDLCRTLEEKYGCDPKKMEDRKDILDECKKLFKLDGEVAPQCVEKCKGAEYCKGFINP